MKKLKQLVKSIVYDNGEAHVYEIPNGEAVNYWLQRANASPFVAISLTQEGWRESTPIYNRLVAVLNTKYPTGLPGKSSTMRQKILECLVDADIGKIQRLVR